MNLEHTWANLKGHKSEKNIPLQYEDQGDQYYVWFGEAGITYFTFIPITVPAGTDQADFEDNHKANANQPINPTDPDNRTFVRSGSRKFGWNTNFTNFGDKTDSPQEIYGGKSMCWDFGNTDDDITPPAGYKKKRLEISFIDPIQLKEGAVYFKDAPLGSIVEFLVVCPSGQYYLKNDGTPALAASDTPIHKFVKTMVFGDCPMGDEFNSEEASDEIGPNYKFWADITVPDVTGYADFKGHVLVEVNRVRSVILE